MEGKDKDSGPNKATPDKRRNDSVETSPEDPDATQGSGGPRGGSPTTPAGPTRKYNAFDFIMRSQCKQERKQKDSTAQAMEVEEEEDVETESEATFAAAVKRVPKFNLFKLVHSMLLYLTFTVLKGARSTGDKVRGKQDS